MDYLNQHIESLIFSCNEPIKLKDIESCLESVFSTKVNKSDILQSIDELITKYSSESYAFEIIEIAGGYQFLSKGVYFDTIAEYLKLTTRKKLSKAALETLAIVAYKQPVSKSEIEKIRGVNCDYTIQKLLEKELINILGRDEGPGRPLIYGISEKFMDHFGISGIEDLPKLKEFDQAENQIGEPAPVL